MLHYRKQLCYVSSYLPYTQVHGSVAGYSLWEVWMENERFQLGKMSISGLKND